MLDDFIKFTQQLFPSIDPYTAKQAQDSIRHYIRGTGLLDMAAAVPSQILAQGDIVGPLTFFHLSNEGDLIEYDAAGLLLSNTCDADRDEYVVLCPCVDEEEYARLSGGNVDLVAVKKNLITSIMYVTGRTNWVVDLSKANGFPRSILNRLLSEQRVRKHVTLNQIGYYFFMQKLTVHLLRPEDGEFNHSRFLG